MATTCPIDNAKLTQLDDEMSLCTAPSDDCAQYYSAEVLACSHAEFGEPWDRDGQNVKTCEGCGFTRPA